MLKLAKYNILYFDITIILRKDKDGKQMNVLEPSRDSSASLRGRSPGFTPAGDPRMSGRAFRLPERPEEAKSSTGSTSVIPSSLYEKKKYVNCLYITKMFI